MTIYDMLYPKIQLHTPIRMFEAFSGIGTQAMALKRLGVPYEIVGFSEIDKYAIQSYHAIHGDVKNYGDITKMTEIPSCDIFTWSFPCTDLSKAGKRQGMTHDTRSGLVYEVLRLVRDTKDKPKVLIMENVPDLIQATFVKQFGEIQYELETYGYTNYVDTLNSKDYGVAQNRNRVFMVSILGEYSYTFPQPFKLEKRLKDYLEHDVDEKYYLSDKFISYLTTDQTKYPRNQKFDRNVRDGVSDGENYANTITTREGNVVDSTYLKIKNDGEPKISYALGSREHEQRGWLDLAPTLCARDYKDPKVIMIPEDTKQGYAEAHDGDGVYINRPEQKRDVVQKGMIQTIKTSSDDIGVVVLKNEYSERSMQDIRQNIISENDIAKTLTAQHQRPTINGANVVAVAGQFQPKDRYYNKNGTERIEQFETRSDELSNAVLTHDTKNMMTNGLRIRKLTPRETWRLMGCSDQDFDKAQAVCSNSQLYKQAGNAIVVDVFENILRELL